MPRTRPLSKSTRTSSVSRRHPASRGRRPYGWLLGLGILLVLAIAYLVLRPGSTAPTEVSAAQAYARYQQGALFVDVRTQQEWDQGHIAGSILIPLDDLPTRINDVPRDRDVVVVCRSGARSTQGAAILRQAGYSRVTCMSGGIQSWVAAGYPLE